MPHNGRKIVCLVGSTLFKPYFEKIQQKEALKGNIVLSIDNFVKSKDQPAEERDSRLSPAVCELLDELMEAKIEMADEVIVVNCGGYIGASGQRHINYALKLNKPIIYAEERR